MPAGRGLLGRGGSGERHAQSDGDCLEGDDERDRHGSYFVAEGAGVYTTIGQGLAAPLSGLFHLVHELGDRVLGIPEEHHGLGLVVQVVLDPREPGVHAPFQHDHVP